MLQDIYIVPMLLDISACMASYIIFAGTYVAGHYYLHVVDTTITRYLC